MKWRLMTIGSTDVCLHLATLLFIAYAWLMGFGPALLVGMLSICLHEGAHAVVAALCGQPPVQVEISPLGAVMRLEDEERLPPLRRMLMLSAGPAMTLLICFLALRLTARGILPRGIGALIFQGNLSILLMNLLPALPLDGGRLLALLLSLFLRPEALRRVMRCVGSLLGVAAIAANLYVSWRTGGWNLSLASSGCFLLYSAAMGVTTQAMAELRQFMDRKIRLERRGSVPCRQVAILAGESLRHAVRCLAPRGVTVYLLIEAGSMRRLGTLTEHQVIAAYLDHPEDTCATAWRKAGEPI